MAATRSHFQTLPLLVILHCVLLCDCSPRDRYSLSSGSVPSQSRNRGDTAQQPEVADERGRGRLLYSSVLEQSTIPDYTVRTRMTDINSNSSTYLHNFEFSDVQVGDSARFTPIDNVTAELVTTDLSWTLNADFEVAITSFWISLDDEGTISYRVETSTFNIVYDRHGGPNGEFRQRSCVGDFVLSTPSVTAHSGMLYTITLNGIEDEVRRDLTTEICKLFDPAENSVTARQLDSFKEVFERTCPPIPHGIFTDCPFTLNSACAVSCEEGYTTGPSLTPDATVVCIRRGAWNIPEESVCVVASCDNSPDACTEEGETCIDQTPSGFRCQCDDGYIRNSDDTACIAASCDNSPDACPEEGETCIDQTPSGFRCECDDGYIRNPDDTACIVFSADDVFDDRPSDGTVFDGETYHLTCSSRIPTLELSWFKDGSALAYSERILKLGDDVLLRDVTSDDSGLYVCVASDEEGAVIAEASSRIDVLSHDLNDDECGIVTSSEVVDVENRRDVESGWIVGGRDAKRGSAPWMARLFVNGPRGRRHICGGSLVDRQWVVTAAHCLDNLHPEDLSITLGDHDTLQDDPSEISVRVEAFYEHEDYNEEAHENDIALIKLVTPLTRYSDYIRPICLANRAIDKELLIGGTRGRVNGWGATSENGDGSVYLQEVFLPFVKYKKCRNTFREIGHRVTRSMFCAGYEIGGKDACQGDSGGPYSNKKGDRWYLTGIVSWGIGCARPGKYGVYTRYSKYHEWLQDIINDS